MPECHSAPLYHLHDNEACVQKKKVHAWFAGYLKGIKWNISYICLILNYDVIREIKEWFSFFFSHKSKMAKSVYLSERALMRKRLFLSVFLHNRGSQPGESAINFVLSWKSRSPVLQTRAGPGRSAYNGVKSSKHNDWWVTPFAWQPICLIDFLFHTETGAAKTDHRLIRLLPAVSLVGTVQCCLTGKPKWKLEIMRTVQNKGPSLWVLFLHL